MELTCTRWPKNLGFVIVMIESYLIFLIQGLVFARSTIHTTSRNGSKDTYFLSFLFILVTIDIMIYWKCMCVLTVYTKNWWRGFWRARDLVMVKNEGGEIHVTHKTAHPFNKWEIERLAEEEGLCLIRKMEFNISDFPGYSNKKGSGIFCDASFPIGKSSTFMFQKRIY